MAGQSRDNGANHKVTDYAVAENMNTPDPDPREEYQHVNWPDVVAQVSGAEAIAMLGELFGRRVERRDGLVQT